jgi:hypothetical protein
MVNWPWSTDTREDKARRVALSYRRLIELALQGQIDDLAIALAALDTKWLELGQGWIKPVGSAPLRLDDWLPPGELSEMFNVDMRAFRDWARRGHIRVMRDPAQYGTPGYTRYCVGDIVSYWRKRSARATLVLGQLCP